MTNMTISFEKNGTDINNPYSHVKWKKMLPLGSSKVFRQFANFQVINTFNPKSYKILLQVVSWIISCDETTHSSSNSNTSTDPSICDGP